MSPGAPVLCDGVTSVGEARETFGYLDAEGDQLYVVHHHAVGVRRAAVLLCGPMGASRERAHLTLVLLARALAAAGCDVVRFDYRGHGESTGQFEELCLSDWLGDVRRCAAYASQAAPDVPLGFWGVRLGALLASECFRDSRGAGLMLLAPPEDGHSLLQEILRRTLMALMIAAPQAPRATREEIIERLARGEQENIDGYFWSRGLWHDAQRHSLFLPGPGERRPCRLLEFKGTTTLASPVPPGVRRDLVGAERFWEGSPLLYPRTTVVTDATLDWARQLWAGEARA